MKVEFSRQILENPQVWYSWNYIHWGLNCPTQTGWLTEGPSNSGYSQFCQVPKTFYFTLKFVDVLSNFNPISWKILCKNILLTGLEMGFLLHLTWLLATSTYVDKFYNA